MRSQGAFRRPPAIVAFVLAATVLASCQTGRTAGRRVPGPVHPAVVVASFNFAESRLLGAIYAFALEHAGIPVRWQLDLGPRELVLPALQQGLVDVVPEYLGSALRSVEPAAHVATSNPVAVHRELARVLARWRLEVLPAAAAADQNGLAVTRATAVRFHLATVSDLAPIARSLVLGGPPECPHRAYCLAGLQAVYGLQFARFLPFDTEQQRVAALQQGVVNVAVMFSTDGYLATGDLAWLSDNRYLQPAENVVPVVSRRAVSAYGSRLVAALNSVSARLDSNDLIFLNWRVDVAGENVIAEAHAWLERQGLLPVAAPGRAG